MIVIVASCKTVVRVVKLYLTFYYWFVCGTLQRAFTCTMSKYVKITPPIHCAIPVITPPEHCACTEPYIQFLCLYIVLVCDVCGTVKLWISIKPDAKYKPSDNVYSAHDHNYNYLHTLKWLYTSVSS